MSLFTLKCFPQSWSVGLSGSTTHPHAALTCPLLQAGGTGAAGTTGASAAKPATPAGSAASGCARPPASRDTPATAPERRSAPATRRSALVSDFLPIFFFSPAFFFHLFAGSPAFIVLVSPTVAFLGRRRQGCALTSVPLV